MVFLDQNPVLDSVGGRLTRDDDVFAVLRVVLGCIWVRAARGQIWVLPIERGAGFRRPVQ